MSLFPDEVHDSAKIIQLNDYIRKRKQNDRTLFLDT